MKFYNFYLSCTNSFVHFHLRDSSTLKCCYTIADYDDYLALDDGVSVLPVAAWKIDELGDIIVYITGLARIYGGDPNES